MHNFSFYYTGLSFHSRFIQESDNEDSAEDSECDSESDEDKEPSQDQEIKKILTIKRIVKQMKKENNNQKADGSQKKKKSKNICGLDKIWTTDDGILTNEGNIEGRY